MLFSRRNSLVPDKPLQLDGIDDALRSALWSVVVELVWKTFRPRDVYRGSGSLVHGSNLEPLLITYWLTLLKEPTDTIPRYFEDATQVVREHFFGSTWYGVFDLVECTLGAAPVDLREGLVVGFNRAFERELSGYRIISEHIVEIANPVELEEVDKAGASPLVGAATHIKAAVALFANRGSPDYRNVVKESISAVESVCRILTGEPNVTLGAALNTLQPQLKLHGALKSALSSMYGYTSDASGIRHAMLEPSEVSHADAKFMLVTCSAFVNFLLTKATEAGLEIPKRSAG